MTNTTLYKEEFNIICELARANESKKEIYKKMSHLRHQINTINLTLKKELEESKADPGLGALLELWEKDYQHLEESPGKLEELRRIAYFGEVKEDKK